MKTKHTATPSDINYVRSVLTGKIASSVCDGDLTPPTGSKCTTRSGFRAWLRRAKTTGH